MIYIATPYSHAESHVRYLRYIYVTQYTAALARQGFSVFSPITHSHPLVSVTDLPLDWEYWAEADKLFLSLCDHLHILCVSGYLESTGVNAEIKIANNLGIKIKFVSKEESDSVIKPLYPKQEICDGE